MLYRLIEKKTQTPSFHHIHYNFLALHWKVSFMSKNTQRRNITLETKPLHEKWNLRTYDLLGYGRKVNE